MTAPAAMPSVEEIHELLLKTQRSFQAERDAKLAGQGLWPDRSPAPLDVLAKAVSALFAPILAEKQKPTVALNHWKARALAAEAALAAERERAAQIGYRVCAETRHVTLGDKVAAAIRAEGE